MRCVEVDVETEEAIFELVVLSTRKPGEGSEKGSDLVRVTDDIDFSYYAILNLLYKK